MTKDTSETTWSHLSKLDQLKHSLGNLLQLAKTKPSLGFAINLSAAAAGFALWHVTTGLVSWAAFVYGILSLLGIVKWVFGL